MLSVYGQICGWTLARAHARSGDRVAIAAYLGGGDMFDRGHRPSSPRSTPSRTSSTTPALVDAIAKGEVQAESGI